MALFDNIAFKMPPMPSPFTPLIMMLKAEKGLVNVDFELDDPRDIPSGCRLPLDWEPIPRCPGYFMSVTAEGYLNVDSGAIGSEDLILPFIGMERRTLFDCVHAALWEQYQLEGKMPGWVHPSWYSFLVDPPPVRE